MNEYDVGGDVRGREYGDQIGRTWVMTMTDMHTLARQITTCSIEATIV